MKKLTLISAVLMLFFNCCVFAQGNDKIVICHYPPGNPDNPQTISISVNALEAHLAHGDQIGVCGEIKKVDLLKLEASPNPYPEQLTIEYDLREKSFVNIEVYDLLGVKIHTLANETKEKGNYLQDFSAKSLGYDSGIYLLKAAALSETEYVERTMIIIETE